MRRTALLFSVLMSAPLAAQDDGGTRWTFTDARGGFCIWYLADPDLARELVPKGTVLRPAGDGVGLPAAVTRVIQDEPRFGTWVPATICVNLFGQVAADGRTLATAKADEPILIMTHSLAASSPRGVSAADHYLVELGTDRGSLARAAELLGARSFDRSVSIRKSPDSDDDEVELKLGKTKIFWQGHRTGAARVGTTRSMSFGYAGLRTTNWQVEFEFTPSETFLMVGALRVEGKDDLGKALRASPIRTVGPSEQGGAATLTFQAPGTK